MGKRDKRNLINKTIQLAKTEIEVDGERDRKKISKQTNGTARKWSHLEVARANKGFLAKEYHTKIS